MLSPFVDGGTTDSWCPGQAVRLVAVERAAGGDESGWGRRSVSTASAAARRIWPSMRAGPFNPNTVKG